MTDRWLEGLVPKRVPKNAAEEPPAVEEGRVPVVVWVPVVCPVCSERDRIKIYRTQGKLRYHACHACGCKFKSLEQLPQGGN